MGAFVTGCATVSPAMSARIDPIAPSRLAKVDGLTPSVSTELSPAPMPISSRSPTSSRSETHAAAVTPHSRVSGFVTPLASLIRLVAIAAAPSST